MLCPGSILNDRYRLDDRVATGGMGDVWRGTDLVLGRQVAVKVLLPSLLSDPSFIQRFHSEARIMAALHHPGIVQVYDTGEDTADDGTRSEYLVMEYVDGVPLSRRIDEVGGLSVAGTLSIVEQAARALHAAHGGGIVHRDVKPSNLLVKANGRVVLVDFGVARSTGVTSITSTNAIPGTALYMAPEQAAGKPVSAATDVYALGAVAYCCLTGEPPFTGENPLEVAIKHLSDEPPPLPAEVPEPVRAIVERALAKDPGARFPDAAAMADAASAAASGDSAGATMLAAPPAVAATTALAGVGAAGTPTAARPAVRSHRPTESAAPVGTGRKLRTTAGLLGAVLLGLAGLTAVFAFQPDDDRGAGTGGGAPPPTSVTTGPTDDQESPSNEDAEPTRPIPAGVTASTEPSMDPSADTSPTDEPSAPATTEPTDAPSGGPSGGPPTGSPTGGDDGPTPDPTPTDSQGDGTS
ncbi:serine/threonine-protein kinase [Plantactinospora sp. GCM10030261]|uniref:serine/threonine-protein kinase n=1 Tax=Plantactinospora sp. GCM10030261 TaxID=3273420 RepID=UPI00361F9413